MPKLFEYLGYIFFFYSNDHLPIHCHVVKENKEAKIELELDKGMLVNIHIRMTGRNGQKLTAAEKEKIKKFVTVHYQEIIQKWNDLKEGKRIRPRKINKEIK